MSANCVQAVQRLHEEVAAIPEGECEDMLVLPIYAALPPELQVSQPRLCRTRHRPISSVPQHQKSPSVLHRLLRQSSVSL